MACVGAVRAQASREIEVFTREGCPRCEAARASLDSLAHARPGLRVVVREVDRDPAALERLRRLSEAADVSVVGVPSFWVRGRLLVGFDTEATTGRRLREILDGEEVSFAASELTCSATEDAACEPPPEEIRTGPFALRVSALGLPLFTLALGLLDGFNPCAMWVLLFLLSMLVNFRDRRRMALVAGTFVAVSGLVYFAFMAAWLHVFLLIGLSRTVQVVLGLVALGIGAINVKDFFAFKQGVSLSIPESAKPNIYARVRGVLRANTLAASLAGVAILAVLVNFVELLCTAGFPAVYTAILAEQKLSPMAHYAYLGLYNLAYVLDDAGMVSIAVFTLSKRKLTERAGRWLKLVSGVVMLALALALLLFPEWLR